MGRKEYVLVNKTQGRFTINFKGMFLNKFAAKGGKFYLTEKEMDFVKASYPHILGTKLVFEGEDISPEPEEEKEDFFKLHHTKWKPLVSEMSLEDAEAKLAEAELNGIDGKIVTALQSRILELSN